MTRSTEIRRVRLVSRELRDWESFHDACAQKFGFGQNYGRNADAWLECMAELEGPVVAIEYVGKRLDHNVNQQIVDFLLRGVAAANGDRADANQAPNLMCIELAR